MIKSEILAGDHHQKQLSMLMSQRQIGISGLSGPMINKPGS
jgi:hypothetical protein